MRNKYLYLLSLNFELCY